VDVLGRLYAIVGYLGRLLARLDGRGKLVKVDGLGDNLGRVRHVNAELGEGLLERRRVQLVLAAGKNVESL